MPITTEWHDVFRYDAIMVLAHHATFSTYGFWLPNDPRGSQSDSVRSQELRTFGAATKTDSRRSVARLPHDRRVRREAKESLKYPLVVLEGLQARAAGRGFARAVGRSGYAIWACSILPEHMHIVVARHKNTVEQVVAHLKGEATKQLFAEDLHPLIEHRDSRGKVPSPWSQKKGWMVYLDSKEAILRSIKYVADNPLKDGKKRQHWDFVVPFGSQLI